VHGNGILRTHPGAKAAAVTIVRSNAFAFNNAPGIEWTDTYAFPAACAPVSIGNCHEISVDEGVVQLPQFAVYDIGNTTAGAAVAYNVFVVFVNGTVHKYHVKHPEGMAFADDLFCFFFVDFTVLIGKCPRPCVKTCSKNHVGFQWMITCPVTHAAPAGSHGDPSINRIYYPKGVGEGNGFAGISQVPEGAGKQSARQPLDRGQGADRFPLST